MCTVTWWLAPDGKGYEVFFNRDELRTRGPATPPTLAEKNGVPYLAPKDADFGGTWLLINAHGVTLGLVNHYPLEPKNPPSRPISRGLLARDLADCADLANLRERLTQLKLRRYGAFFLFACARAEKPRKWTWDTKTLLEDPAADPLPFLTSSSFRTEDVRRHRRDYFAKNWAAKNQLDPANLWQFHLWHDADKSAFGVLMDRGDARTVSFSHITVGRGLEAVFAYQARNADGTLAEPATQRLPLLAQPTPATAQ